MPIKKSLNREILVWFIAYSILLALNLIWDYSIFINILPWQIIRWLDFLIEFGTSILLPVFPVDILGLAASFFTLVFAHRHSNLCGWRLISIYMLPHPLIVSLFQASQALFFHKTDTSPLGWLMLGGLAYFLLTTTAYIMSKLFTRLSSEL